MTFLKLKIFKFCSMLMKDINTNTFNTNTFCHNILSTFTAVYSQSAENRDKFLLNFYQRVQIFGKYRRNYQDQTDSLWVIRHHMLEQNVLGLISCAFSHLNGSLQNLEIKNLSYSEGLFDIYYTELHRSSLCWLSLETIWNTMCQG